MSFIDLRKRGKIKNLNFSSKLYVANTIACVCVLSGNLVLVLDYLARYEAEVHATLSCQELEDATYGDLYLNTKQTSADEVIHRFQHGDSFLGEVSTGIGYRL